MPSLVERLFEKALGFFGFELVRDETKHLVVHRTDVERTARDSEIPIEERYRAITAMQGIRAIHKPIFYDFSDLSGIAGLFQSGDKVILYGTFLGQCLDEVYKLLSERGIEVSLSPGGCV